MALIVTSGIVGQISGKLGGVVYSRGTGGPYVRNRTVPVVTGTPLALMYKNAMGTASVLYQALSKTQKRAWEDYAATRPEPNRLGQVRTISGQAWYIRLNSRLLAAGQPYIDEPPAKAGPGMVTIGAITATAATQTVSFTFADTPIAAGEILFVRGANLHASTKQYVKNVLRQIKYSDVAQASPLVVSTEFTTACGPIQVGDNIWLGVSVIDTSTGQRSMEAYDTVTTT